MKILVLLVLVLFLKMKIKIKNPKLKISQGEFEVPESLENEEFDCTKRKANAIDSSGDVDFDEF